MKPWIRKYQPESTSGIKGQDKALSQVKEFVSDFRKAKKKALILYGPPGCGKTASAYAVGNESDLEIVEVNASDFRNKAGIESRVGVAAGQMSLFSKGKIILLDEIDGISGTKDRGGVPAIAKIIDNTQFPIIMTSNNPWDKKFNALRKKAALVEFHTLNYLTVFNILKEIADKEKAGISEEKIKSLARRAGGDLRAAINDIQSMSMLKGLDLEEISERNRKDTIIEALVKVFKTTDPEVALTAFDSVDENLDTILLWVDENLPKEYTKPKDLARAYDKISKADVFKGRIRRWQYWRFLVYINQLLSAGVALSKKEKYKVFNQYKPTTRILKIWKANMKYQRRKAIAQKIGEATHTSSRQVLHSTLPYMQNIFRNNKEMSKGLTEELDLDDDDVAWLSK